MNDPFGRPSGLPPGFTREDRIAMALRVADALLAGRAPEWPDAVYVGQALSSYLRDKTNGDLARDHLRISAPQGSRRTPSVVAARLIPDERQGDDVEAECDPAQPSDEE